MSVTSYDVIPNYINSSTRSQAFSHLFFEAFFDSGGWQSARQARSLHCSHLQQQLLRMGLLKSSLKKCRDSHFLTVAVAIPPLCGDPAPGIDAPLAARTLKPLQTGGFLAQ